MFTQDAPAELVDFATELESPDSINGWRTRLTLAPLLRDAASEIAELRNLTAHHCDDIHAARVKTLLDAAAYMDKFKSLDQASQILRQLATAVPSHSHA